MIETKVLLENTRDLNVLYVEDDIIISTVTQELFHNYFHSLDVAFNGEEGLEQYISYKKEKGIYYDLVITDINMPKLGGLDMSKQILKLCQTQPIMVISAHNTPEYLLDTIETGINGFILKPIEIGQFTNSLFKVSQSIIESKMLEVYLSSFETLPQEPQKVQEVQEPQKITEPQEVKEEYEVEQTQVELLDSIALKEQVEQLINDDLFELEDILGEVDVCLIGILSAQGNVEKNDLEELIKHFSKYAAILGYYTFFNKLSSAMKLFADTMQNNELPQNSETCENLFIFLESFVTVLAKWHEDLSSGNEENINQLDASLISDINTITNMWVQKEEEPAMEDLDDIFDF